MFNTPHVGQPVQYLPAQGSAPVAAIVTELEGSGLEVLAGLAIFPPAGHKFLLGAVVHSEPIPHMDAHGPQPLYPCWREAK